VVCECAVGARDPAVGLDSLLGPGRSVRVICLRSSETMKKYLANGINCLIYGDKYRRGELTLEFIEGLSEDRAVCIMCLCSISHDIMRIFIKIGQWFRGICSFDKILFHRKRYEGYLYSRR